MDSCSKITRDFRPIISGDCLDLLDRIPRLEQDAVSTRRTLRGTFGSGSEPPKPPIHPGFYALVRHMARVAAERDYERLVEEGIQPNSEGEEGHD